MKLFLSLLVGFLLYSLTALPLGAQSGGMATLLNAVTATGASSSVDVSFWRKKNVEITVAGTATVTVQMSHTSAFTNAITVGSLTATGQVDVDDSAPFLRANVTACTSCTVTATLHLQ